MQQKYLLGINPQGWHKIAYTEWGYLSAPESILCVHGLTRNGRDFDYLAQGLQNGYRIVCPDLVGRGASDYLPKAQLYSQQQYVFDLIALIARMDVKSLIWVGTSLGGILGMYLAAQSNSPIKALILNDVGPQISLQGLRKIAKYTKGPRTFTSLLAAEKYLRNIYQTEENISDEQWHYRTQHSVQLLDNGEYSLAYDPQVISTMRGIRFTDIKLWHLWDKIKCPVLVVHGQKSEILLPATTAKMQSSGPKTTVVDIEGCGHTPTLMTDEQIALIKNWLITI